MDFSLSDRVNELSETLWGFMRSSVLPAEAEYRRQVEQDPHRKPPVVEDLKREARARNLWNLFLPDQRWGAGLSNVEYAPLAEIMGWSHVIAPEATNCSAPDTGNMELLIHYGSDEHQRTWLEPLLDGRIRSCFAMSEPGVASSDAENIRTTIRRDGDSYLVNGRKWWITAAGSAECKLAIIMGVTDPDADRHHRQSMILVPMDSEGVEVVRRLPVFGYDDVEGEWEIAFDNVRVAPTNLLGSEGSGFAIAQARLGPGRIHHCMRLIGMAERALGLACERATTRTAFGKTLAEQGVVQSMIVESRLAIEQARLLVLKTAWLMDTVGNRGARQEISAIKAVVPRMSAEVIDRAIQVHGAAGLSEDFPLASMYAATRILRIADGPDEVHKMVLARNELRRHRDG
jgi:acyl-CoA dehydrogenase